MSFNKLNLDLSRIDDAIERFGLDEKPDIKKKGDGTHYWIIKNGEEALTIFYFKKDGTTTIDPNAGKNTELSTQFAEFIRDECLITSLKSGSISAPDISEENLNLLFEYIKDIGAVETLDTEDKEGFKIYRLKSPFRDEVTLTYYNNKTLLVQGIPLYLFQEIKLFLYELLPLENVAATESETYQIDIKPDQIREELEAFMPTAYHFLDDKIIKILTPALSLRKLEIELEDYTCFAFPALRGLEGYIRQLIQTKASTKKVRYKNKLGELFEYEADDNCVLCDWVRDDIACKDSCIALESAYKLYKAKRHPFFHVKNEAGITPIIWKKDDAESLIVEVFDTIEKTFSRIP